MSVQKRSTSFILLYIKKKRNIENNKTMVNSSDLNEPIFPASKQLKHPKIYVSKHLKHLKLSLRKT